MILNTSEVDIIRDQTLGTNVLIFKFKGEFTQAACERTTTVWKDYFQRNPQDKFTLVWDCTEMTTFDAGAKREWVKYMQILSSRINEIIVVSDKPIIRGAARLILKLFKFENDVFRSMDDLRQQLVRTRSKKPVAAFS